ncbi:MAG: DUF1993 domain-containing protein [Burkholderiales bacterium]
MKITMHQASAPRFAHALRNLSAILDKAQAWAEARKIDPKVPGGLRLIADMFPLSRQVQIACDTAKGAVARLAGVEIPRHEDTEQTIPELKARIARTIEFIASVPAAKIDGSETREVVLKMRGEDVKFKGLQYLFGHACPNFYFHLTTAYNILRANGVELGKRDFIGTP